MSKQWLDYEGPNESAEDSSDIPETAAAKVLRLGVHCVVCVVGVIITIKMAFSKEPLGILLGMLLALAGMALAIATLLGW